MSPPSHSISLFLIAYEPINAMLLIRTTSLSCRFSIVESRIPRRVRIVIKRMRNHVLIHFSQGNGERNILWRFKGTVYDRSGARGLGNHILWLQPRKILTRDLTFPMERLRLQSTWWNFKFRRRDEIFPSFTAAQLGEPHSVPASFRAMTQAPINSDHVTMEGFIESHRTFRRGRETKKLQINFCSIWFTSWKVCGHKGPVLEEIPSHVCVWIFYRWGDKYKENRITYAKQENIFIGKIVQ